MTLGCFFIVFFYSRSQIHEEERLKVAEALRVSEEKFREVVEGTDDLITKVNSKGEITYVNHMGEKFFGFKEAELIGMSAFEFLYPEDQDATVIWFKSCIDKQLVQASLENRQVNKKNGEVFSLLWTTNFHYDGEGHLSYINGIAHDISERKLIEEEAVRTKKLEATAILAGGIAHDFNNLLAAVSGYIDMALFDLGIGHRNANDLNQALIASKRAQELTNKFITFSSGGTPVKKKLSIKDLIIQSVDAILSDVDLTAEISLEEDLWLVEMDSGQMSQVFKNVLLNSKESMEKGGVVQVRAENVSPPIEKTILAETSEDSKFIKITITDQGKGIPAHVVENIFDPYFSTKDRGAQKGMGLGLTLHFQLSNNMMVNLLSTQKKMLVHRLIYICQPLLRKVF